MPGTKHHIAEVSPAEDRRITRAARTDPDNPPLGEAELVAFRPAAEVMPDLVQAFRRSRRKPRKVQLTLRLDPDIIDFFRAGGRGWQTRINAALREYVERQQGRSNKT